MYIFAKDCQKLFRMTIIDRIQYLIGEISGGNQADFARAIGSSPQTISSIVRRGSNPSFTVIHDIMKAYPEVNPYWLILGVGDAIIKGCDMDYMRIMISGMRKEIDLLEQTVRDKDRIIGLLGG